MGLQDDTTKVNAKKYSNTMLSRLRELPALQERQRSLPVAARRSRESR